MTPEEAAKAAYSKRPRRLAHSASEGDSEAKVVHWEDLSQKDRELLIAEHWEAGPEMVERIKTTLRENLGHAIDFSKPYGNALLGITAREIIREFRRPTDEMMNAAAQAGSQPPAESSVVKRIWQAAIAAALGE